MWVSDCFLDTFGQSCLELRSTYNNPIYVKLTEVISAFSRTLKIWATISVSREISTVKVVKIISNQTLYIYFPTCLSRHSANSGWPSVLEFADDVGQDVPPDGVDGPGVVGPSQRLGVSGHGRPVKDVLGAELLQVVPSLVVLFAGDGRHVIAWSWNKKPWR